MVQVESWAKYSYIYHGLATSKALLGDVVLISLYGDENEVGGGINGQGTLRSRT